MARGAALFTSDASLVRCELGRARPLFELDETGFVLGVGAYDEQVVLQRRFGVGVARTELWALPDTDVALFHAGLLPLGQPLEENAQPFRFHQWLFALVGEVDDAERVREQLFSRLPQFLQRSVRGRTLSEVCFATFLTHLREAGRTDDPNLEALLAGQLLVEVGREVTQVCAEVAPSKKPGLALFATNGRVLAAARRGGQPLAWSLLEGERTCERCGLDGSERDTDPRVREHLRRRSVLLATEPTRVEAWAAVPDGGALVVDRRCEVQTVQPK